MAHTDTLILRLLGSVKMLAGLTTHHARDLLAQAARMDVVKGEHVLRESESSRDFYIVVSGEFAVVRMLSNGKEKIIAKLRPGDSFGEMSFLDGRPRAASVIADADGLLLRFERTSLQKIPDTAARVYFNLANLMAERIRDTNSLISLALEQRESSAAGTSGVPAEALQTHHNVRRM